MLKYFFAACVAFTLLLQANNQPPASPHEDIGISEDMFTNDECDAVYDTCIVQCDDTKSDNDACYSKCEELYEECLLKKERTED